LLLHQVDIHGLNASRDGSVAVQWERNLASENDPEPEKIERENKTAAEKLRDLLDGLKIVEEYERTIPAKR
jgi:hypothetical protein